MSTPKKKITGRGGPGRGQGRKPSSKWAPLIQPPHRVSKALLEEVRRIAEEQGRAPGDVHSEALARGLGIERTDP